jgi:hypothetical protein
MIVEGNTAFLFAEPPIRLAKGLGGSSFFAPGGSYPEIISNLGPYYKYTRVILHVYRC